MNLRPLVAERSDNAEQQATQPEPEPEDQAEEHFEGDAPQAYEAEEQVEGIDDAPHLPTAELPEQPATVYPTLEEYQKKWDEEFAVHAKCYPTAKFSLECLVPKPIPNLWQDCPYVPFDKLKSEEAQARLTTARPHSAFQPSNVVAGVPRYSHITGEVCFRRRASHMLTSMMGFILNKNDHRDMRNLTPEETHALHECLTWCRTGLNNKVLQMFFHSL